MSGVPRPTTAPGRPAPRAGLVDPFASARHRRPAARAHRIVVAADTRSGELANAALAVAKQLGADGDLPRPAGGFLGGRYDGGEPDAFAGATADV